MAMPILCADCEKANDTKNHLECKEHIVCQDCFKKRVQSNYYSCTLCASDGGTTPGIHIFVDDSNVWIGAKMLQARVKGFESCEDHRVRLSMGKLANRITNNRTLEQGILYGSEPPPADTVWKRLRENGWTVKTFNRSVITNKEKQIDTQLVADVTETAIKTPLYKRSTIVVVSGDADMIPALEKILKEEKWKIEVFAWEHTIAKGLKIFADEHRDRVEVKYLDPYLDEVIFTSMKFPIPSNKSQVKDGDVVLTMVPDAFRNRIPDKEWCSDLESIAKWPFQYYWFEMDKKLKATDHLVLVFLPDREGARFDFAHFLGRIKNSGSDNNYNLKKVKLAQTFLNFSEVIKPNEDTGQSSADGTDCVSSNEVVPGARKRQNSSEPSPNDGKKRCELSVKKEQVSHGYYLRKTKECKYFANQQCSNTTPECNFAHGSKDAWCQQCHAVGHYTKDCPCSK